MKTYTAIIACLTLASACGVSAGEDGVNADSRHTQSGTAYQTQGVLGTLNPDQLEGKDVTDRSGNELGDIDEIVKDSSGVRMAVIGLDDSIKEVAVPLDHLAMSADGDTLTTTLTRSDLEALPDYDPMDMESVEE